MVLSSSSWGCELKLFLHFLNYNVHKSSSSWGCELKYFDWADYPTSSSHPLREDVSWNVFGFVIMSSPFVILFVRMWVEIVSNMKLSILPYRHPLREDVSWNSPCDRWWTGLWSSSSWGCELKYFLPLQLLTMLTSSSSWGCELKYSYLRWMAWR